MKEGESGIHTTFPPSEKTRLASDTMGSFFSSLSKGVNELKEELKLRQRAFLLRKEKKKKSRNGKATTKQGELAQVRSKEENIANYSHS